MIVDAVVEAIASKPKPMLIVVRSEKHLSEIQRGHIRLSLDAALSQMSNPPPVIVVPPGMTIEAILDPRDR